MTKERATIEYCDNPNCLDRQVVTSDEPAVGYHFGKGFWVLGGGGPIPAFFAHSKECIIPALEHIMDEQEEPR